MATKKVTVTFENGDFVIDPAEIKLKRNADRMIVQNKSSRNVTWIVPEGVFTELGGYSEGIKAGKVSQDPAARFGAKGDRVKYTVKEAQPLRGKRRRRARSRRILADPVLIID